MAFNKDKALERAEKYVARGQHDKAAKEYQSIVDADGKDIRAWLMLADCLTRAGDPDGAIDRYLRVAQFYAAAKQPQKAVAVYRQVLNLAPDRADVQLKMAAAFKDMGRLQDAAAAYEQVAAALLKAGKTADAITMYASVADLDPTVVSRRLRLAELYSREGMVDQAVEQFRASATQLRGEGRRDDYIRVAERLIFHKKDDAPTLRDLARAYLEAEDPRRALVKLNALLHVNASDREGLELLAQTFVQVGKPDKAASVVLEVVRELNKQPEDNRAAIRAALHKGLAWAPGHPELSRQLHALGQAAAVAEPGAQGRPAQAAARAPAAQAAARAPAADDGIELVDDVEVDDGELLEVEADEVELEPAEDEFEPTLEEDEPAGSSLTAAVVSEVGTGRDPGGDRTGDEGSDVDKVLYETRVYMKYRLFEHALDHLQPVLDEDAEHVGALQLRGQCLASLDRRAESAATHLAAAKVLLERDPDEASRQLRTVLAMDGDHAEAKALLERLAPASAPAANEPPAPALDIDLGIDSDALDIDEADFGAYSDSDPDASERALEQDDLGLGGELADESVAFADAGARANSADDDLLAIDDELLGDDASGTFDSGELDAAEEMDAGPSEPAGPAPEPEPIVVEDRFGLGDGVDDDDDGAAFAAAAADDGAAFAPADDDDEVAFAPADDDDDIAFAPADDDSVALDTEVEDAAEPSLAPGDDHQLDAAEPAAGSAELAATAPESDASTVPATTATVGGDVGEASGAADTQWPALTDEIEEVEFFLAQGLDDDAEFALGELERRHPGHPGVAALRAKLSPPAPAAAAIEPSAPAAADAEPAAAALDDAVPAGDASPEFGFDLDDDLAEDGAAEDATDAAAPLVDFEDEDDTGDYLSAIFDGGAKAKKQTKLKAVAQVDEVDAATSYDLATAYKEMGLADDALAQLALAASDPVWRARALIMAALVRLDHGRVEEARNDLQEAVDAATSVDEVDQASYELSIALERLGDVHGAIDVLQGTTEGYRDRDARLASLRAKVSA